jgi:mannan endo-1,4-beta-mannosidase
MGLKRHLIGFIVLCVAAGAFAQDIPFKADFPEIPSGAARAIPPRAPSALVVEAEDGDFMGVKRRDDLAGFTGEGYAFFPSYDKTTLGVTFNVPADGWYALRLRACVIPDQGVIATAQIDLGETPLASQRLPVTGVFSDALCNKPVRLAAGEASFYVTALSGEWALDSVSLEPLTAALYSATLPRGNLVTPNAIPAATAVYRYLLSMQGKGILSGQQVDNALPEIKAIKNVTGKYPAVLGLDYMDLSATRVARGTRSFANLEAQKWWKAGGLVTIAWHWNAPADLIDKAPDRQWFSGFYTRATTFDFVDALDHPEGEKYRLMLADIDTIAKELAKLRDAGIPVLWRPLHEASGGWFWWGNRGSEGYLRLYKLLFDRLVNYHHLTNLIWVWNGQNAEWYPGDDYVDIVSTDVYPPKREYTDHADIYLETLACAIEPKLVAMSENGTLPDIDALASSRLGWSWFCTWDGEFVIDSSRNVSGEYTEVETLKRYYDHPWVITRDELPAFR